MPKPMIDLDDTPPRKKVRTFEEAQVAFKEAFIESMSEQVNQYDGRAFAQTIIERLNQDRHAVIWKMLGLDDKWGTLEVDHSNGRTSPIVNMLEDTAREAVQEWLKEAAEEVMAANRPKMKAIYRKAFEKEFVDRMDWYARQNAQEAAKSMIIGIQREVEKEFKEGVRNVAVEKAQREGPAGQADQA